MSPPSNSSTVSDSSTSSDSTEVTPPQSDDNDQSSQSSEEEDDTEEEDEDQVQVQEAPLAVADVVPEPEIEVVSPPSAAAPSSSIKKIWDETMQILLLKEMVDFSKTNGSCKISKSYVTLFHSSLKDSPIGKFSANQMLEKMKGIKKRYDNPNGMGKDKDAEMLELSNKLWGDSRRMVKGKKRKRTKDDNGDDDSLMNNVGKDLGDFMVKLVKAGIGFSEDNAKGNVASTSKKKRDGLEKLFSLMGEMVEVIVDLIGLEKGMR